MKNRIKKMITITLVTVSILGNITPVQATECSEAVKAAPMVKVIDCNDLTEKMLTTRADHNIMYIERIYGIVTDNEKNGKVLNPPEDGGYYISYASVEDAEIGDTIITYCVYNPFSNYDDDVIERWDFIQQEVESMKEVKYTYHHTASDRGYIPVGKEIKEPYKGRYGRGYVIKRNNPRSSRYYLKDYYIRKVVER